MNETAPSQDRRECSPLEIIRFGVQEPWERRWFRWFFILVIMPIVLACFGVFIHALWPAAGNVYLGLLFGWWTMLDRAFAAGTLDGPGLMLGLIALMLVLLGTHVLGRALVSRRNRSANVAPWRWTWRSTLAAGLGITVLFAAGVAIVGTAHQLVWLATTTVPPASRGETSAPWLRARGPLDIIGSLRDAAFRSVSRNNLKQIGLALHNYHDVSSQFPPGAIVLGDGSTLRGWIPPIASFMPFVDEWSMSGEHRWDTPEGLRYGSGALPDFIHPAIGFAGQFDERGSAFSHYAANVHMFPNNRGMKIAEVTDGTSQTLAVGEVVENFQPWASPYNRRDPADGINAVPWGFGGPLSAPGAQFLFADGTVRMISRSIDRRVLTALGTPSGGDTELTQKWLEGPVP